jgi:hypothetical protein
LAKREEVEPVSGVRQKFGAPEDSKAGRDPCEEVETSTANLQRVSPRQTAKNDRGEEIHRSRGQRGV